MEYRQMKYVLKVAEEQSFSQAAKKLYIAQPSLSQCIQRLEKQLGVLLFDRTSTPLRLTFAGELYIETAKRILDLNDQMIQQMDDIADLKKGRLTIGSSPFRSTYLLPQVLPLFQRQYPGIEIVLAEGTTAELEEFALNGTTDFSIVLLPISENIFAYEPILTEELLIALSPQHPLSKQNRGSNSNQPPWTNINISELKDVPFILMKHGQRLHQTLLDLCAQAGFKPKIILESQSMEAAQALVVAGLGATLLPDTLVRLRYMSEHPCYFSIKESINTRTVVVAYRKEKYLSKAARLFISLMKERHI
jgi:DNA-binding transcriptional LysR family regulator